MTGRPPTEDELARVITEAANNAAGVTEPLGPAEAKRSRRSTRRRVTLALVMWVLLAAVVVTALAYWALQVLAGQIIHNLGGR